MSREDNILYAKRNIVASIYKEARLEGLTATFAQTKQIYEGGVVAGLRVSEIVAINNLKHAWQFVLDTLDVPVDIMYARHLNGIIGNGINLRPGEIRATDVEIGGTAWRPKIPNSKAIRQVLEGLYSERDAEQRVLDAFVEICRGQWFYDGNKRTAQLIANKELIYNGCGILAVPEACLVDWQDKLIRYYETGEKDHLTDFLKTEAISWLDMPKSSQKENRVREIGRMETEMPTKNARPTGICRDSR